MPGNPWFSWQWVIANADLLATRTLQHLLLTLEAVALAAALAVPLAVLVVRRRRLAGALVGAAAVVYTVPSLALFAILAPLLGIGRTPVLVGVGGSPGPVQPCRCARGLAGRRPVPVE